MPAIMGLTFAEYMEEALYGPRGYYASGRGRSGKKGDYFTATDTGPTFGRLLAAIFVDWQRRLNVSPFHLVECGAGEGAPAENVIALGSGPAATRGLTPFFRYIAVERSAARRAKLAALGSDPTPTRGLAPFIVLDSLDSLAEKPICGCLFANELLDAFPVHRVRCYKGQLQEAYIDKNPQSAVRSPQPLIRNPELETRNCRLVWGPPSTSRLQAYLDRIGVQLPEGYETEINLAMADWFRSASAALSRGLALIIDYGRPAHENYAPERITGTLRAFRQHRVSSDILDADGDCDLTADVDFTSAALDAQEAGFVPLAFMELGSFLMQGVTLTLHPLPSREREGVRGSSFSPLALQYLIHPEGMGSAFQVLILGKGIPWTANDFEHNRLNRLGITHLLGYNPSL